MNCLLSISQNELRSYTIRATIYGVSIKCEGKLAELNSWAGGAVGLNGDSGLPCI